MMRDPTKISLSGELWWRGSPTWCHYFLVSYFRELLLYMNLLAYLWSWLHCYLVHLGAVCLVVLNIFESSRAVVPWIMARVMFMWCLFWMLAKIEETWLSLGLPNFLITSNICELFTGWWWVLRGRFVVSYISVGIWGHQDVGGLRVYYLMGINVNLFSLVRILSEGIFSFRVKGWINAIF